MTMRAQLIICEAATQHNDGTFSMLRAGAANGNSTFPSLWTEFSGENCAPWAILLRRHF